MPVADISSSMSANLGNGSQFRYESQLADAAPKPTSSLDEAASLLAATQR